VIIAGLIPLMSAFPIREPQFKMARGNTGFAGAHDRSCAASGRSWTFANVERGEAAGVANRIRRRLERIADKWYLDGVVLKSSV
jgi:hypothetical protein